MSHHLDLKIHIDDRRGQVSALLEQPPNAWLLYVLAHGAGAGMRHKFMDSIVAALAARGVATLRYQFPYMEAGGRRTDSPAVAEATVQAAVVRALEAAPGLPVVAGGKSFGGRMTSGAAARGLLPAVRGLVFLGFPLHPPGRPGIRRADHLDQVTVPMLFLQGTRDEFADLHLLTPMCQRLEPRASLHLVDGANHSFAVPKRLGREPDKVIDELADAFVDWAQSRVMSELPG